MQAIIFKIFNLHREHLPDDDFAVDGRAKTAGNGFADVKFAFGIHIQNPLSQVDGLIIFSAFSGNPLNRVDNHARIFAFENVASLFADAQDFDVFAAAEKFFNPL